MVFFHGDHGKNPICPLISSGQGLFWTSRYTQARSKLEEILCDSGTDSPRDFKKTVIDNPIEMDTSPLGAALGESE